MALDDSFQCSALREAWPDVSAVGHSAAMATNLFPQVRSLRRRRRLGKVLTTETALTSPGFSLDVFSGAGHVAAAARQRGYDTLEVDVVHGVCFDLLLREVRRTIIRLARHGRVLGSCIGVVRNSFSVARNRTRPIRSVSEPWGLSSCHDFTPNDQNSLGTGNIFALFTIDLVRILYPKHIPWIIENPSSSIFFKLPQILNIWETHIVRMSNGISAHRVHDCANGLAICVLTWTPLWHLSHLAPVVQGSEACAVRL